MSFSGHPCAGTGVCVLASSSAGNCTFVAAGGTRILIDTGNLPIRTHIQKSLMELGFDYRDIDAIFISHAHADHLNGNTFSISHRNNIPIYLHHAVMESLRRGDSRRFAFYRRCRKAGLFSLFDSSEVAIGRMRVQPFEVPHDSRPTVGFAIKNNRSKITIATDVGRVPAHLTRHFKNSDLIIIESNHDVEMEKNSPRSYHVIRRNLSDHGHLSNEQAKKAMEDILQKSTKLPSHIFLAHISKECNTPALAYKTMSRLLKENGLSIGLELTFPRQKSSYVQV